MGFVTLGSGHVIHTSQLPNLNPPGSIEVAVFNEETGGWDIIVEKTLDPDISDIVTTNLSEPI